jgi:hypothetical protein
MRLDTPGELGPALNESMNEWGAAGVGWVRPPWVQVVVAGRGVWRRSGAKHQTWFTDLPCHPLALHSIIAWDYSLHRATARGAQRTYTVPRVAERLVFPCSSPAVNALETGRRAPGCRTRNSVIVFAALVFVCKGACNRACLAGPLIVGRRLKHLHGASQALVRIYCVMI